MTFKTSLYSTTVPRERVSKNICYELLKGVTDVRVVRWEKSQRRFEDLGKKESGVIRETDLVGKKKGVGERNEEVELE